MKQISCVYGDLMKEFFEMKEEHKATLDNKLKSKFGEYADSTVNTIPSENGGHITLSFGMYDVKEELVNFAQEVTEIINNKNELEIPFTIAEAKNKIQNLIDCHNLNLDLDWEEKSNCYKAVLFYNDEDYKTMVISNVNDQMNFEVMDALYDSIKDFVDDTMKNAIKVFDQCWYYNYSSILEDIEA